MHKLQCLYEQSHGSSANVTLRSPPDIFAVCAYFAKVSGAYTEYSDASEKLKGNVVHAASDGKSWRDLLNRARLPRFVDYPPTIRSAWKYIGDHIKEPISDLRADKRFVASALYLIVAADEACAGVGVPSGSRGGSYFELQAEAGITKLGTLCRYIPSETVRILPKQHTPTSGLNLRSITHHLAFCAASEVTPIWSQLPKKDLSDRTSYNVLLAPWPLEMAATDILPSSRKSEGGKVGYFDYSPRNGASVAELRIWLNGLFDWCDAKGQRVDLVVFPEAALNQKQWDDAIKVCQRRSVTIIAGVRGEVASDGMGGNSLRMKAPFEWHEEITQYKHHRWKIDGQQVANYGLGGTLRYDWDWWENIRIQPRALNFVAVSDDLVLCPLICEDLARQDPVAELVRSVGPNLVIGLLMDGPQLAERWSARYATVLAEDPGSSVLTISSLGMVALSRPSGFACSRIFASWKDPMGRFTPIEMEPDATAVLLNLQFNLRAEYSADNRSDDGVASTPVICGMHFVR